MIEKIQQSQFYSEFTELGLYVMLFVFLSEHRKDLFDSVLSYFKEG